jgi:DNA uptake protein ComE-like DNA-binding protein
MQAGAAYAAALVTAFVITGIGQKGALASVGTAVAVTTWLAGMMHAALVRRTVGSQLAVMNSSDLKRAQQELARREYGRRLLKTNPSLARQLGVGRPDVTGSDSFGLVDVNHVGPAGLMMLPSVTEEGAKKILEYRNGGGYFVSVEDLAMYLDLPQTTIGPLRDTAVFDLGTS